MAFLRELTDSEFHETMIGQEMKEQARSEILQSVLDDYAEEWLERSGPQFNDLWVEYVYRNGLNTIEHILLNTGLKNVYLVILFDLASKQILGHHLIDLNVKYGLPSPLRDLSDE